MKDSTENPLIEYQGIQIFGSDIEIVTNEYLNKLSNPDLIYTKVAVFNGLLDSIYKKLLKPMVYNPDVLRQSYDYQLLDNIFRSVYLPVCHAFNKTPTILAFCVLVDIDNYNVRCVKNGFYADGTKVSNIHKAIVTKWYQICESGLSGKALEENSIGAMFYLKARYNWREASEIVVQDGSKMVHETAAEIAQRYANARLPEKPEL